VWKSWNPLKPGFIHAVAQATFLTFLHFAISKHFLEKNKNFLIFVLFYSAIPELSLVELAVC